MFEKKCTEGNMFLYNWRLFFFYWGRVFWDIFCYHKFCFGIVWIVFLIIIEILYTYLIHSRNDRSNVVPTLAFEPRTSYTLDGCLTYCAQCSNIERAWIKYCKSSLIILYCFLSNWRGELTAMINYQLLWNNMNSFWNMDPCPSG